MSQAPEISRTIQPESLFERLFAFSPDAIIVSDRKGRILEANAQAERFFGYSRAELLGSPVEMLMPERFRHVHPGHRDEYDRQPRVRPMGIGLQLFARRKDGSEFPVDIMLSPVETDAGSLVLSVIRDITEKKRAQEALERSERQFRSVVESVKDYAIHLLDAEGRISTWSPGSERIYGYSAQEALGRSFACFYTPGDVERHKPEEVLRIAAQLGRYEEEGWSVRKDGSHFWANVIVTAIGDESGHVLGFARVARDFSERKKMEEAILLELSGALLSTRNIQSMLAAFSAGIQQVVAHDYAAVALLDPETNQLRLQSLSGGAAPSTETVLPLDDSAADRAFASREPLLLASLDKTDLPLRSLIAEGLQSACWLPLVHGDRLLGTLIVASRRPAAFTQRDLDTLGQIGNRIAAAFDNAMAFDQIRELSDRLIREKRYLEEELKTQANFEEIIGESPAWKRVLSQVETAAPTEATILILGETGTGKELIARAIHQLSGRRDRTMVKLNCAAIPAGLLESELFGHEKGAFTGALAQKIGRLELAHRGTLFLDEVGDIPLELQPKLLRALQEKEFERLGGTRTIPVDVRLIAATNRDLGRMVADRQFRSDLYYRLRVFPIVLPPLRERREDIPLLASYFVQKHARRMDRRIETIPPEVMQALMRWHWPGNVRELENFIERAVILSRGPALRAPLAELEAAPEPSSENTTLESAERDHILRVLRETKGVIGGPDGAAVRLGLKRTTLNSKLKKLGISREDYM